MKAPSHESEIRDAVPGDAEELLPLMRAYCEFYEAEPSDDGLLELARTLCVSPEQGALLIARRIADGRPTGFVSLCWKWSSLQGARIGVMEDLFVDPVARGTGLADALIAACAERCRQSGMPTLHWFTAPDNHRAQAVYNRVGGTSEPLLEYELAVAPDASDALPEA